MTFSNRATVIVRVCKELQKSRFTNCRQIYVSKTIRNSEYTSIPVTCHAGTDGEMGE